MNTKDILIGSTKAARALRRSVDFVRAAARDGRIPFTTTAGGHHRYRLGDVEAFRDQLQAEAAAVDAVVSGTRP